MREIIHTYAFTLPLDAFTLLLDFFLSLPLKNTGSLLKLERDGDEAI